MEGDAGRFVASSSTDSQADDLEAQYSIPRSSFSAPTPSAQTLRRASSVNESTVHSGSYWVDHLSKPSTELGRCRLLVEVVHSLLQCK